VDERLSRGRGKFLYQQLFVAITFTGGDLLFNHNAKILRLCPWPTALRSSFTFLACEGSESPQLTVACKGRSQFRGRWALGKFQLGGEEGKNQLCYLAKEKSATISLFLQTRGVTF